MQTALNTLSVDSQIASHLLQIKARQLVMLQSAADIGHHFLQATNLVKSGASSYTCERIYQESGFTAVQVGKYIRFYQQWGDKVDQIPDAWSFSALAELSTLPQETRELTVIENPEGLSVNEVKKLKVELEATKKQLVQTEEVHQRDIERLNIAKKLQEKDFQKQMDDVIAPYQQSQQKATEIIKKYKDLVEKLREEQKTLKQIVTTLENNKVITKANNEALKENKILREKLEELKSSTVVVVESKLLQTLRNILPTLEGENAIVITNFIQVLENSQL